MLWKAVVFAVLLALMIPYIRVQGRGAARVRSSVYRSTRRVSRPVTRRPSTSRITHNPVNNIPVNNVPVNNVPDNNVPDNNVPFNNIPVNKVPSHSNTRAPVGYPTQYPVKNRATTRTPLFFRRTTKRPVRFSTTTRSFGVSTNRTYFQSGRTPSNVLGGGVILPGFQGERNPSNYPGGPHRTEPKRTQSSTRSGASEESVASLFVLFTSLVLQKSMSL